MPTTTRSQATGDQEATSMNMESRIAELEDQLKRVTSELEALQLENEVLKRKDGASEEDVVPSQVGRMESESQSTGRPPHGVEETKKMHQNLRSLMDKYKDMERRIGAYSLVDQLLTSTNLLYSVEIMAIPLPPKFNVLMIEMYDGTKDPVEHLKTFKAHMKLHGFLGEIACWAFLLTLKGAARGCFGALQPGSVDSFENLGQKFLTQFMASRRRRRSAVYLLTLKQKEVESLKAYLVRFNRERMTSDDHDEKNTLTALLGGISPRSPLWVSWPGKLLPLYVNLGTKQTTLSMTRIHCRL